MVSSSPLACDDCPVRDHAVCAALDGDQRRALSRIGRTRAFERGATIFAADDANTACATLISGLVKLSTIDADGNERIVAIVHPAGFLGRLFATATGYHATAITDCRLCLFPRGDFEAVMHGHPALTERILARTLQELDRSRALTALIGRHDAGAKVAGLLLGMARGSCTDGDGYARQIELPLSRGDMAEMLGITIETVSRQLTRFERAGLITRIGLRSLAIDDPAGLLAVAA